MIPKTLHRKIKTEKLEHPRVNLSVCDRHIAKRCNSLIDSFYDVMTTGFSLCLSLISSWFLIMKKESFDGDRSFNIE